MKQLLRLKTMLLLCALMAGAGSVWGATTYHLEKVTSVEANGLYVFKQDGYVMNNTVSSKALQTTNSYNEDDLTGAETYVWTLEAVSDGGFKMKNVSLTSSAYLTNSSGTDISFGTTGSHWLFNFQTDETVLIQNKSNSNRFLGFSTSTSHAYKAYATSNLSTYPHAIVVYQLVEDTEGPKNPQLSVKNVTMTIDATVDLEVSTKSSGAITYTITDGTIASIANGKVTGLKAGSTTVTATQAAVGDEWTSATKEFTVTVNRKDATIDVDDIDNMDVTTTNNIFYTTNSDGNVTFSSTNNTVAVVEEGVLKALAPGTTKITVSIAQSATYNAVSADFNVTVTTKVSVNPVGSGIGSGFTLVTDATTLHEGDQIIFVNSKDNGSAYAMSTTQNNNNRGITSVSITGEAIPTISNTVQVITLEEATNAWYFNVGTDSYLYAASSSNNHLRSNTKTTVGDNGKAVITIGSTGLATITFQGNYTHNRLQYNSSNSIFSCYTDGQQDIYIYRQNVATSFDITIGTSGWRTLVSAQNVSLPEGVKAYTVTASSTSSATLTEVTSIKANNPYLLNGPAGDCTLTIIDTPTEPTGNLLQVSTETTGNGVYVLANKSNGVGFYKWDGGSLGAGRVYLPAPAAGAREFISFDDETTAIENVNVNDNLNHEVYDLQGRRVAQPSKGLYIINGKKVMVK